MSKILLIKPQTGYDLQHTPPLGLGYISTFVKKNGFKAKILDCNVRRISPEYLFSSLDIKEFPIVGIQTFDMDLLVTKTYISEIRKKSPDSLIIVGGPAPSSDPEFVLKYLNDVDILCVGEGEKAIVEILTHIGKWNGHNPEIFENSPNLVWKINGALHFTDHDFIENLDQIGPPDWEELDPRLYSDAVHGFFFREMPVYPISTSRGCPFRCSFCGSRNITGYRIRRRSPEKVIDELEMLKQKYGMREFQIIDDNFTAPPKEALEFCNKLFERNLDLWWTCPNGIRADILTDELVQSMKASGCYEVAVGIESGDPAMLKDMGKNTSPDKIAKKIHMLNDHGVNVTGFVMIGYPGETEKSIERSLQFILDLPLKRISLTRFVPMLGTPIMNRLIENGEIDSQNIDPSLLDYGHFTYITPAFTEKRLRYLYRRFFLKFVLRPHIILHNLRSIRSLSHLKIIYKKLLWFLR